MGVARPRYLASVGWVVGDLNRYLLPVPGLVLLLVVGARQMLRDGSFPETGHRPDRGHSDEQPDDVVRARHDHRDSGTS